MRDCWKCGLRLEGVVGEGLVFAYWVFRPIVTTLTKATQHQGIGFGLGYRGGKGERDVRG